MNLHKQKWQPSPLDYLALVGGVINAVVITTIIGYWLLQ